MNHNILAAAHAFATAAHTAIDQRRKYTNEPYITHPEAVAALVMQYGGTETMVAAAYLHDVVEDTPITIEDIRDFFGSEIASIVDGLTDVSEKSDGSRALRKALDREHIANASYEAQFVKCADLIHNTSSITKHDKNFAKIYMKEKELLLEVMTKVHDTPIFDEAKRMLELYYA